MIVILSHPELDMEILDADIETAEFDNCKEMSRKDGDANSVLTVM